MNKLKKLGSALVLVVAIMVLAACPLLFSACSNSSNNTTDHIPVAGDTYVFETIKFDWADDATEEDKAETVNNIETIKESKIVFTSDNETALYGFSSNQVEFGHYTVIEDRVVCTYGYGFGGGYLIIKGNTLILLQSDGGSMMTVTYKLSK